MGGRAGPLFRRHGLDGSTGRGSDGGLSIYHDEHNNNNTKERVPNLCAFGVGDASSRSDLLHLWRYEFLVSRHKEDPSSTLRYQHRTHPKSILFSTSIIDNEFGCELAEAGYTSVAAIGLYYSCLIIVCCRSSTPESPLPEEKDDADHNHADDDDTTVRTHDLPHRRTHHHDLDDTRSTGGASQRSRSRSVHFWDE